MTGPAVAIQSENRFPTAAARQGTDFLLRGMGADLGPLLRRGRRDPPVAADVGISLPGLADNHLPLDAQCREVEVQLLEALGETDLPPLLEPVNWRLTWGPGWWASELAHRELPTSRPG